MYRKIYFDIATGNVIYSCSFNTSYRRTTFDEDYEAILSLKEREKSTIGFIEFQNGEYERDFAECSGFWVNPATLQLEFSYPDPNTPEPVYQKPLTEEVTMLKSRLLATEQSAADNSLTTQQLLETLIDLGVI